MQPSNDNTITSKQLLLPVGLLVLVIFLLIGFQTLNVFNERQSLQQTILQQEKPLEDVKKVQTQLDTLAVGTLKLSQKGDKEASAIIEGLKKLGITVKPPTEAAPAAPETKH